MFDVLDRSLASRRFSADLVGGFAALALLLASNGIYGLLAYIVGQRSGEIGIRMALGARRDDILRMFLRKGCTCWRGHHCRSGLFRSHRVLDDKFALWSTAP